MTWIKKAIKASGKILQSFYKGSTSMNADVAKTILRDYSPDREATCIGKNALEPQYDLQIIIPAYNVENYIAECLKSVFEQVTSFSYIVTVVNDGSTDRTGEIIKHYRQKFPHLMDVINQKNKGLSGARNTGMKTLKGRYIMFLDSDDVLTSGAVEALLKAAMTANECELEYFNTQGKDCVSELTNNDVEAKKIDIVQGSWYIGTDLGGQCDNRQSVEHVTRLSGYPWGKVYRAELFENFQFPEGYWFEDTPISCILYGKSLNVKVINDIVYGYRINPNGITITAQTSRRSIETYYITELCLREFSAFDVKYDQRAYIYFLNQCITNERRVLRRPKEIREAIFVLERELKDRYFSGMSIMGINSDEKTAKVLLNVENTLNKNWFGKFEVLVMTE